MPADVVTTGNRIAQPAADRPRRIRTIRPASFAPTELFGQLGELAQYTDLLYTLSLHRVKVRYKQSALGFAWAILQPLALMLIYTVIFSIVTRMPSEGTPYSIFVYSALLIWTYFASALGTAANGLVTHVQLITKVYFPREIIPLTYVIASLFDFLIASTVLSGLMLYYRVGVTVQILWVIPITLVATMFTAGLAFLLAATQVRFRDIGIAIPLLMQVWMFATPVIYAYSTVPARLRSLYMLNPMVGIVENFRRVVLQGIGPDLQLLAISTIVSVVLLPASYLYFKHREATMADII